MAFILYNLSSKTVADLLAYVKDILYLSSIKPNTISSLKVTKIRKSVSLYGIFIRHSP